MWLGCLGKGSGNKLISFLNNVELEICNGRQLLEPELKPSLDQKLVIDFIVADVQLLREFGEVRVESTEIMSDHFLV